MKKWQAIFGCSAIYSRGKLLIYKNIIAFKMPSNEHPVHWMIMGEYKDCLQISPDGFSIAIIKKQLCKIV